MENNEFFKSFFHFIDLFSLSCEYNAETSHSNKCQELYKKVIERNRFATATEVTVLQDESGPLTHATIIDNPQGNNSNKLSVIGCIVILELSFTLFILYKANVNTF